MKDLIIVGAGGFSKPQFVYASECLYEVTLSFSFSILSMNI
ncbi:MAG: hypothetical protein PHF36_09260 [Candidatus Cloacimonetes bacterium]|nr:hypothetical protein [Candidatus Cloacimonadota bacterium]